MSLSDKKEINRKAAAAFTSKKKDQGQRLIKGWVDSDTYDMLVSLKGSRYKSTDELLADAIAILYVTANNL